jgi:hypothetical protein
MPGTSPLQPEWTQWFDLAKDIFAFVGILATVAFYPLQRSLAPVVTLRLDGRWDDHGLLIIRFEIENPSKVRLKLIESETRYIKREHSIGELSTLTEWVEFGDEAVRILQQSTWVYPGEIVSVERPLVTTSRVIQVAFQVRCQFTGVVRLLSGIPEGKQRWTTTRTFVDSRERSKPDLHRTPANGHR